MHNSYSSNSKTIAAWQTCPASSILVYRHFGPRAFKHEASDAQIVLQWSTVHRSCSSSPASHRSNAPAPSGKNDSASRTLEHLAIPVVPPGSFDARVLFPESDGIYSHPLFPCRRRHSQAFAVTIHSLAHTP